MLASKAYPATLGSQGASMVSSVQTPSYPPTRRAPALPAMSQSFASPTESEFSDGEGPDSVKNWDEDRVCEYLRSVKCGEYEKIFRRNHINGENLLEMDKEVLKEMGIDKVGDRVRLFLGIKKLRTKAYANQKKRNRVSIDMFLCACFLPALLPLWPSCSLPIHLQCLDRTPSRCSTTSTRRRPAPPAH